GMKRTVTIASAEKCRNRRKSRLFLSIGYIQSWTVFGISTASRGKYQVITTMNAITRYTPAAITTGRDRSSACTRCDAPTLHHAPTTKMNCHASGLKNHVLVG